MHIDFLLERFLDKGDTPAIIWQEGIFSYQQLLEQYKRNVESLKLQQVKAGDVVSLEGDFTPQTISMLLALINQECIIVPFNTPIKEAELQKFTIARVQKRIIVNLQTDTYSIIDSKEDGVHDFYSILRQAKHPGLVLFTSGTSGFPKGAVHDFIKLLEKFKETRRTSRTINFLLFDHWGGLNTLFHTLSNGGVVLALRNRKPDAVCAFIEKHKVELLPVSPSFLNLLILSEAYKKYDLSSLSLITYGTEPMPSYTLSRAKQIFPQIAFQQTYGLIELGVLRSKSKSDDSLWVKLGGEGYTLRVADNMLEIKANSAMLGYLNAPSPFTDDGFFMTGDQVEVDGEYYKILGRKSELINVGGDKVYPQEVENIILGMDNVLEVTVYGEKHVMMGNIVCAKVLLHEKEDPKEFTRRLKSYCKGQMQPFKIPVKVFVAEETLYNDRFKKNRQLL